MPVKRQALWAVGKDESVGGFGDEVDGGDGSEGVPLLLVASDEVDAR